jgi:hypothetical protein
LLALELARSSVRYRAALLLGAARLQESVGNYFLALEHLDARARLPFTDHRSELLYRVVRARCLVHVDRDADGAQEAEAALALVRGDAALASLVPFVLDRAALYRFVADEFKDARARFVEVRGVAGAGLTPSDRAWNTFAARAGEAAAALGEGDGAAASTALEGIGEPPTDLGVDAVRDARIRLAGLRAEAAREKEDLAAARAALVERQKLVRERLHAHARDEEHLELAIIESHLAEIAYRGGDHAAALKHLEAGLGDFDAFSVRSGTDIHPALLHLLAQYCELRVYGKLDPQSFKDRGADLERRARKTFKILNERRNPDWESARQRLEAYLTWIALETKPAG